VTDGSGNTAAATQMVTVIDNQKPNITPPAIVVVNTDPAKSSASNVVLGSPVVTDNCSVATITNNAPASYPIGETSVTWNVTDGSGNTSSIAQIVRVIDNEKPVLTNCMQGNNQSVSTDPGLMTFKKTDLSWNAVVIDNDGISSLICTLSGATTGSVSTLQGVIFNLGTTNVTWATTDKSGNTATCSFTVTVSDRETPLITSCHDEENFVFKTPRHLSVYTLSDNSIDAQATDNDRIISKTYVLAGVTTGEGTSLNGVTLKPGETLVTWTFKDNSGNTASCSYKITVLDSNLPPSAMDDHFTVNANTSLSADVKSNDTDLTDPIESLVTKLSVSPGHGKIEWNENGTFTYTPVKEFVGEDHFSYKICKPDDNQLCDEAKVTVTVKANDDCELIIPGAFSPDGDGLNDYFRIKCIYRYPNAYLKIFTRSGIQVYEQEHYGNIDFWGSENDAWWSGKTANKWNVGGNSLMSATYIYILELEKGNKNSVKTGTVFLNK
jgi:hypothetical protein